MLCSGTVALGLCETWLKAIFWLTPPAGIGITAAADVQSLPCYKFDTLYQPRLAANILPALRCLRSASLVCS